jgi:hypothetical protein
LRYTIERNNGSNKVIENPYYNRVFVRPTGESRWVEVLDADAMLYGDVRVVNGKKIEVMTGEFYMGREGLWVTRHHETGNLLVKEHYREGNGKAKGIYREYYENGKPKKKGRYNDEQQEAGVWKEYDGRGRLTSRVRYFNNRIVGFEYCRSCCRSKTGEYHGLLMLHLGKHTIHFRKCHPHSKQPDW